MTPYIAIALTLVCLWQFWKIITLEGRIFIMDRFMNWDARQGVRKFYNE